MLRFLLCATLLLAVTTPADGAAPPQPFSRAVLDRLLVEYRAHGLPEPPRTARLVRYEGAVSFGNDGKGEINYRLGIAAPHGKETWVIVDRLWGGGEHATKDLKFIKPTTKGAGDDLIKSRGDLIFAVQCH